MVDVGKAGHTTKHRCGEAPADNGRDEGGAAGGRDGGSSNKHGGR